MTARDQLQRRAAQRQRIDAGMGAEAPVLIGQQQFQITGIDAGPRIDRQPPAAVGHRIGAQQFSVAIDDAGRDLLRLRQRQRPERDQTHAANALMLKAQTTANAMQMF